MVWEGPEYRIFCPHGVGVRHPPNVEVINLLETLQTPMLWDFMEVFSQRHDQSLTPPSALPSLEDGGDVGPKLPSS